MALERVQPTNERTDIGPVLLYREDLMRISEILSQVGHVEVEVNDKFRITSPDDWEELSRSTREPVTTVKFKARGPEGYRATSISVDLNKGLGNSIFVHRVNNEARGVVAVLKDELREHHRHKVSRWLAPLVSSFVVAPPVAVWVLLQESPITAFGIALPIVFLCGLVSSMWPDPKSKFVNATYAEAPKFRQRLFEDGGVNMFWALFGVVFGGIVGYLVNQLPSLTG